MKRPILWLALPVIAMCLAGNLYRAGFIFVLLILLISIFLYFFILKNKRIAYCFSCILIISFFFILHNFSIPTGVVRLNTSGEALESEFTGRVTRFTKKEDYMSVQLKDTYVYSNGKKENFKGVLLYCNPSDIRIGDVITGQGKVKPLEKSRMEGCFDEKSYYESIRIFSKCNGGDIRVISHDANPLVSVANLIKNYLRDSYQRISPEYAGRLSAITLGDQSLLEEDIKDEYRKNGIGHLLAISGLHISLTGMFFYKFMRRAGVAFAPSALSGTLVIMIYVIMTGGSVSAVRAAVMFACSVFADIPGRSYDPVTSLSLQCMITLLLNPFSLLGSSFLMSYGSVLSIILFGNLGNSVRVLYKKSKLVKYASSDLLVSFSVFAGLLPLNLIFYNEAPVYSVLINLLVIPLSGILIGMAFFAGFIGGIAPGAGRFLIAIDERIFDFYDVVCDKFSNVFSGSVVSGSPTILKVIIYYLILFVIYYLIRKKAADKLDRAFKTGMLITGPDKKKFFKGISPVVMACVALFAVNVIMVTHKKDGFYCTMLDVGQGDSIFIHTDSGRNFLFDAGSSNISNVYSKRVEPFLKSKGVKKLDAVFISHSDADHINALTDMIQKEDIKISNIVLPEINNDLKNEAYVETVREAKKKGINTAYASEGFSLNGNKYKIKCLYPGKDTSFDDINSLSAVYRFEYNDFSLLFTGDVTKEGEEEMLAKGKVSHVNILKVAHHGSNYSSTEEFLKAASPDFAMISCGVNNRYNHPGSETVKRLNSQNIPYKVTSESGALTINYSPSGYSVKSYLE